MNQTSELRLPVSAALCWLGTRAVVADLAVRRVVDIASPIAEILQRDAVSNRS
jgi:hypothetical protein